MRVTRGPKFSLSGNVAWVCFSLSSVASQPTARICIRLSVLRAFLSDFSRISVASSAHPSWLVSPRHFDIICEFFLTSANYLAISWSVTHRQRSCLFRAWFCPVIHFSFIFNNVSQSFLYALLYPSTPILSGCSYFFISVISALGVSHRC